MKMIAGVFYNRLKEGMPLQSTVTVCYALYDDLDRNDEDSWKTCEASTDIDSPYNTYLHKGLPIGPIVNPGEAAIDAVLHPETNDYYYFIADIMVFEVKLEKFITARRMQNTSNYKKS